jgi:hypothetical protein
MFGNLAALTGMKKNSAQGQKMMLQNVYLNEK